MAEWFKVEISFGYLDSDGVPPRAVSAVATSDHYLDNGHTVASAIETALNALAAIADGVRPVPDILARALAIIDPDDVPNHPEDGVRYKALVALCEAAGEYNAAVAVEKPRPPVVDNN